MPPTRLPFLVLLLVTSSSLALGGAPVSAESTLRKLTYPGRKWSLVVDLPGFEFEERATRSDLTGVRISAENKRTGVLLSISLEKAARTGGAKACRAFYWRRAKRADPPPRSVRFSETKDTALVEYTTTRNERMQRTLDNVSSCMSYDGVWMEIHLSKDQRLARDRIVFDSILESVRIMVQEPETGSGTAVVAAPPPVPLFFQAPGKNWGVTLEAPGAVFGMTRLYEFDEKDYEVFGQRVTGTQWNGRIERSGLVLWVALVTLDRDVDGRRARALIWQAINPSNQEGRATDITFSERGELAIVEFMVPLVEGRKADVKNTIAFLGREDVAGVVRISKVDYRQEDASGFAAVLGSIRISEPGPTPP